MPEMTTERLLLRRMRVTDAEDMHRYACRSDVTRYLLWSPHPDLAYTREYLQYLNTKYAAGTFYDWAVTLRSNGRMIGTCGFTRFDLPHGCGELGYVLNPDYHGLGYGTEAAARVMRFGFEELGLHRIEAKFMQGNEASRHVMKKLGMSFEGYRRDGMLVKGKYRTIGCCSILTDEYWEKQRDAERSV
jgi:ribosomal-protein-alanine N-acetyltransferase